MSMSLDDDEELTGMPNVPEAVWWSLFIGAVVGVMLLVGFSYGPTL